MIEVVICFALIGWLVWWMRHEPRRRRGGEIRSVDVALALSRRRK